METILMSIHPKWCEKIFSGEKTIEVRKTAPKPPFKVVIYCTKAKNTLYRTANGNYAMAGYEVKGDIITLYCEKEMTLTKFNGKVIGEFICDETDTYQYEDSRQLMLGTYHNKELLLYETCLTSQELDNYAKGKVVKLLHITSPRLYDKPSELGEFKSYKPIRKYTTKKAKEFSGDGINIEKLMHSSRVEVSTINRPPRSWQYINEVEEEI